MHEIYVVFIKRINFSLLIIVMVSCVVGSNIVKADGSLTTPAIVMQTIAALPSCLQYKIVGICFWQIGPYVSSTLKVSHYIPDAVVTTYNKVGDDPWVEANTFYDQAAYAAGNSQSQSFIGFNMNGGQSSQGDQDNNNTHLKEVDVIGNPLVTFFAGKSFLLPSQATPFFPYYQSMLDVMAWRTPILEEIIYIFKGSIVPGAHDIGTWPLSSWGPVYPRTGFISQPNDAKDAAIAAFRAAHIVTRDAQPHVYKSLSNTCGTACAASQVIENDPQTQWQMLSPIPSTVCQMFGQSDVTNPSEWGIAAAQKAQGAYAFNLWRHYQGCIQGAGNYVGQIDF